MKRLLFLLFAGLALNSHAQKKTIVNGHIPSLKTGSYVYLASNEGKIDSAVVLEQGRFKLELDIKEADGYVLLAGRQPQQYYNFFFFLDEGTINIDGDGPLLKDLRLSGESKFVKDYLDWKHKEATDPRLANTAEVYKRYNEALQKKDSAAIEKSQLEVRKIYDNSYAIYQEWVDEHPSASLSAFIMNIYLSHTYGDQLEAKLAWLKGDAVNTPLYRRMVHTAEVAKLRATGKQVPDFTIKDVEGKPVSLSSFKGQYVFIDFWASWCGPCRAENPNVLKAYTRFKNKNFTVLGISMDKDREKWVQAIKEDNMPWTQVSDLTAFDNEVARLFDIKAIPTNYLISPDGKILAKNLRGDDLDKKLEAYIK